MKKFLLRILLISMGLLQAAVPTAALATDLGRADSDALQVFINHGNLGIAGRYALGTQLMTNQKRAVRCTYDFAVLGGSSAAALTLRASTTLSGEATLQPCLLPKGAVITAAYVDVITALSTGSSPTVAFSTGQAANDLLTATATSSFASGIVALIPVATAAAAIKLTADSKPTITVATAPLTAGKVYVLIEYLLSQTL